MGCDNAKPEGFNIEEEYLKSSWPMPDPKIFENEFEKEAWLTVNVLRSNPKVLIPQLKEVKSKFMKISSLMKKFDVQHLIFSDIDNKAYKGKKWNDLIKELQKQEEGSLAMIAVDENVLKACREINKAQVDADAIEPEVGGTSKKYQ